MNIKPTKHYNVLKGCCSKIVSASSTNGEATIENSEKCAICELYMEGKSFQKNYLGVNMININDTVIRDLAGHQVIGDTLKIENSVNSTVSYITYGNIAVVPNDKYTFTARLSFPCPYPEGTTARIILRDVDSGGNIVATNSFPATSVAGVFTKTFTASANASSVNIELYSWLGTRATESAYILIDEMMLVEGETLPSSYEPYVGKAYSPSSLYPQTIYGVLGNGSKLAFYNGTTLLKEIILPNEITNNGNSLFCGLYAIGNDKDSLTFNGKAKTLTYIKKIGYIDSYNGESVGEDYISSCGGLSTGANVIYKLNTPEVIDLNNSSLFSVLNTCIPNGATKIKYMGNVDIDFDIKYRTKI